jgi:hypothetical protein
MIAANQSSHPLILSTKGTLSAVAAEPQNPTEGNPNTECRKFETAGSLRSLRKPL